MAARAKAVPTVENLHLFKPRGNRPDIKDTFRIDREGCFRTTGSLAIWRMPLNPDLKFLRTPHQIFPTERAGKLGLELVIERKRIVIVDQDEMSTHWQIGPALK